MNIHELRLIHEKSSADVFPQVVNLIRERKYGSGILVGVAFAGAVEALLDGIELDELVGVDPYEHVEGVNDPLNLSQPEMEHLFWYAMGRTSRFGARFGMLRASSKQAALLINEQNEQADFVYLNGDRAYERVKEDLALWSPKVRPGGLIVGRDYGFAGHPGVKRALDEFGLIRNVKINTGPATAWWIDMPAK